MRSELIVFTLGWFWQAHLDKTWDQAIDAPPLPAQFEMFGVPVDWEAPGIQFSTVVWHQGLDTHLFGRDYLS